MTKVIFPVEAEQSSQTVTLEYDDVTNTVTITDEEGGKVTERSDWANRLVEARQYCNFEGETEVYGWRFDYDSLDHKVRRVDPAGNRLDGYYDGFNHLKQVTLPLIETVWTINEQPTGERPELEYEYDKMGNRTAEIDAKGNRVEYEYDKLGRRIKVTTKATDIMSGEEVVSVTRHYYDAVGNKVQTVDAKGNEWRYTYSARGYLLTETDPEDHVTRYRYDELGNKIAVSDPRGNGADGKFTTWFVYDDLNRLSRTVSPDDTPPGYEEVLNGNYDNPYTETVYDAVGNKLSEKDLNGLVTTYTYYPRNWVKTVGLNGEVRYTYHYDRKGNRVKVVDALNNETVSKYDSLGRLRRVSRPLNQVGYGYDSVGNMIWEEDGRKNKTQYQYNGLGWLTRITDPLKHSKEFYYDPNGNQLVQVSGEDIKTYNRYDELNRLIERIDALNNSTKYSYDRSGNRLKKVDPRGTEWDYGYYDNNRLKRLELTGEDGSGYWVEYTYDPAGNRKTVTDSGNGFANSIKYNWEDGEYRPDPLNRTTGIERSFAGATYRTVYRYDRPMLLTGIKYPEAEEWVSYKYNDLNQLTEVVGFTGAQGFTYDDTGALQSMDYSNGAVAVYRYDQNRRLDELKVTINGEELLALDYGYDFSNNITSINEKTYEYDGKNQLIRSYTAGTFLEDRTTPGRVGKKSEDYFGRSYLDFTVEENAVVNLDYNSTSIGLDFGREAPSVKQIVLTPDKEHKTHRITENTLDLFISSDNTTYGVIPRNKWSFHKDDNGVITLTLEETIKTRYLKIHVLFDDRGADNEPVNKAQFLNELAETLKVYQEATSRREEYQYDADGNRKLLTLKLVQTFVYKSEYYPNSHRLKSDGRYEYAYDNSGNLIRKERIIDDDQPAELWEYEYDLLHRLLKVEKNGTIVAEYGYDPEGYRVVKRAHNETIHYVFAGTEPVYEKNITKDKAKSYIYALGQHLARVDGVIGDPNAKIYFYHTDQIGSVRAVTNQAGEVVWNADYLAFGTRFGKITNSDFEEWHGFTGKEYDPDTGLYYYNARWYDSDIGRFISEDPAMDPNNPNLYVYGRNNPLGYIDPTGEVTTTGNIGLGNPGGVNYSPNITVGGSYGDSYGSSGSTGETLETFRQLEKNSLRDFYDSKEGKIQKAERDIPGFEYSIQDEYEGFGLENQIQIHLILEALEDNLKADGKLGFFDKIKINIARNQLKTAFNWLDRKSPVINLFKDKAEYYTADQIEEAVLEVGCFQSMVVVGAIGLAPGIHVIEGMPKGITDPANLVKNGQTAVIGKMNDLNATDALRKGEFKVADYLPDLGNPKLNWKQKRVFFEV